MKYLIFLLGLQLIGSIVSAQTPANDSHWELIFEDNFNTLDDNIWEVVDYAIHNQASDGGLMMYMAQNVSVSNGNLIIQQSNNPTYCPPNPPTVWGGCWPCVSKTYYYTSGWIETKPDFAVKYGYIEAEIKLPFFQGQHPSFWTYNIDGSPSYDEIDIFEMLPEKSLGDCTANHSDSYSCYHDENRMTTNAHPDFAGGFTTSAFRVIPINDYTQWHKYAVEWSPSKIIWYVDGRIVSIVSNTGINELNRIILSFGMDRAGYGSGFLYPYTMLVNYVKMYQLKTDCNNSVFTCNYDFTQHDNKVKNNISIGSGGCSNTVPVGTQIVLRASEGVSLSGNFSVPYGASLYADAGAGCSNSCAQVFNPCLYDFNNYDNNQVKQAIKLGGSGTGNCEVMITSTNDLSLKAASSIVLKSGVTITPQTTKSITLKLETCN